MILLKCPYSSSLPGSSDDEDAEAEEGGGEDKGEEDEDEEGEDKGEEDEDEEDEDEEEASASGRHHPAAKKLDKKEGRYVLVLLEYTL